MTGRDAQHRATDASPRETSGEARTSAEWHPAAPGRSRHARLLRMLFGPGDETAPTRDGAGRGNSFEEPR